jgi:hypothetical protein
MLVACKLHCIRDVGQDHRFRSWYIVAQVESCGTEANIPTASQRDEDRHRMITNPYWRSPESWIEMPWGTPADIWSFGAVLRSLLSWPSLILSTKFDLLSRLAPYSWNLARSSSNLWVVLYVYPSRNKSESSYARC